MRHLTQDEDFFVLPWLPHSVSGRNLQAFIQDDPELTSFGMILKRKRLSRINRYDLDAACLCVGVGTEFSPRPDLFVNRFFEAFRILTFVRWLWQILPL